MTDTHTITLKGKKYGTVYPQLSFEKLSIHYALLYQELLSKCTFLSSHYETLWTISRKSSYATAKSKINGMIVAHTAVYQI